MAFVLCNRIAELCYLTREACTWAAYSPHGADRCPAGGLSDDTIGRDTLDVPRNEIRRYIVIASGLLESWLTRIFSLLIKFAVSITLFWLKVHSIFY